MRKFLFSLALALGKTVRQLENEMDSRELSEWICYSHIDPWDNWRGDLNAGIIASTLANINRKKGSTPLKPSDFMPEFGKGKKQKKKQTAEQMKSILLGVAKAQEKKTTTRKKK